MLQVDIDKIQDLQTFYENMKGVDTNFSCLIMGLFGVGKTTFCCTGRLPVLIDSFDPRGTVVIESDPKLRELREKGGIIIRPFWSEQSAKPVEYDRWEKAWQEDIKSGFLKNFGTYAIDSGTLHLQALVNQYAKRRGRIDGQLQIQDYPVIYNILLDVIQLSSSQGCDFIYTGHLVDEVDEVTKGIRSERDTFSKLKSRIPIMFTEKYVLRKKQTSKGVARELLTVDEGRFRASTQLGAQGKLLPIEVPNLKEILKKVGFPIEDKPFFPMISKTKTQGEQPPQK